MVQHATMGALNASVSIRVPPHTRTHAHVALGVQRAPEGWGKNSCLREGNSVRENETYFPLQALSCLLNSVPYAYTIYSNYRIIKKLRGLQS